MSLLKPVHFVLQPHPASEAAAATVVASGAQTTIKVPRAIVDDDLTDGADTYVDSWQDEPLSPATTVYGAAPPPPLARQQTFGRVSALCSHDLYGINMVVSNLCHSWSPCCSEPTVNSTEDFGLYGGMARAYAYPGSQHYDHQSIVACSCLMSLSCNTARISIAFKQS